MKTGETMSSYLQTTEVAKLRFTDFHKEAEKDRLAQETLAGASCAPTNRVGVRSRNFLRWFGLWQNGQAWNDGDSQLAS